MTLTSLILRAAEGAESGAGSTPYWVGGGTFVFLTALVVALVMFGAGREHS